MMICNSSQQQAHRARGCDRCLAFKRNDVIIFIEEAHTWILLSCLLGFLEAAGF